MRWAAGILAAAALLAGCGSGDAGAGPSRPALTVSAAASLKRAFTDYGRRFRPAEVRFSFAGSDELAAQITQGVRPDVFASANTTLPAQLHAEGRVESPVTFAANRLVLAVPAEGAKVASLADAGRPGVRLAIGSKSVPIGAYTRTVLGRLPPARAQAIFANVRSEEPDVAGIAGKLTQGAVDAGFVYFSDVRGAGGRLKAIELPQRLEPSVAYASAVVTGAKRPREAQQFIDGLLHGAGREALARQGFAPPP